MQTYFYTLLITSVTGTVFCILAGSGFEKYIKYIAAIITVAVVISPLKMLLPAVLEPNLEAQPMAIEESQKASVYEKTEQMLNESISTAVFEKFGVKTAHTRIEINEAESGDTVTGVILYLDDKALEHKDDIIGFVKSGFGITPQIASCREYLA